MHEATLPALAPMLANTPLKVLCVWAVAEYGVQRALVMSK